MKKVSHKDSLQPWSRPDPRVNWVLPAIHDYELHVAFDNFLPILELEKIYFSMCLPKSNQ